MTSESRILVATESALFVVDSRKGTMSSGKGLGDRLPSALARDPHVQHRAWCGTTEDGVFLSDDNGASWRAAGLQGSRIMAVSASPARKDLVWVGTEPSDVWRSHDAGESWEEVKGFRRLPSSSEWSFPPRPETHHVRWIACHPHDPNRLWVAVEAGALVTTLDGGESWEDRREGSPRDTHELAIHPHRPRTLRVAAGDGYFESHDEGENWQSPLDGLEVTYMRSVAVDPGNPHRMIASAASKPRTAYVAGRSDGRLYRRVEEGAWERVTTGWPEPPDTIAPLLRPGTEEGHFWAADERGIHLSRDGGEVWAQVAGFRTRPQHIRGFSADGAAFQ